MPDFEPKKHEKVAFGAVILGGLLALIFGFAFVGRNIFDPLRLKPKNFLTLEEQETQAQAELRTKDTDQDGLTDYDEIYLYRTSAYLPDSDSDGFSDKTEIDSDNDPNCPTGRDCGNSPITAPQNETAQNVPGVGSSDDATRSMTDLLGTLPIGFGGAAGTGNFGDMSQILNSLPPEQIRALLLQNGVPQSTLDALDDDQLMQLYRESVTKAMEQVQEQNSENNLEGSVIPTEGESDNAGEVGQ